MEWGREGHGCRDPASGLRDGVGVTVNVSAWAPTEEGTPPGSGRWLQEGGWWGRAGITSLASSSVTRNYKVPGGPGQGGLCQRTPSLPEAPSDMIKDQAGCSPHIPREEVGLGPTY